MLAIGVYSQYKYCNFVTILGDFINVSRSDPDPVINWWIKSLQLFDDDKSVLREGKELTCNIINAAGSLLKQQFPNVQGFQDTVLAHNLKFSPMPVNGLSIQIINTGNLTHYTVAV